MTESVFINWLTHTRREHVHITMCDGSRYNGEIVEHDGEFVRLRPAEEKEDVLLAFRHILSIKHYTRAL